MSQFLGAGNSGLFSLDHLHTEEPFMVHARARNLDELSWGGSLSYMLCLTREFRPENPPQVKWVNWRWPRYEYEIEALKVRASSQWVVHKGTVLQQFILEISGEQPIHFEYQFPKEMLIRDLDYLNADYPFNYVEEGYSRMDGPNGYGHVCINTLDRRGRRESVDAGNDSAENNFGPDGTDESPNSTAETQLSEPGLAQAFTTDAKMADPVSKEVSEAQEAVAPAVGGRKLSEKARKSSGGRSAVAAIMNPFVNGNAVKSQDIGDIWHKHTLGGSESGSDGTANRTLEIVVAYKLILLPDGEVDWRNFLVSEREANVSNILREETNRLWENASISSLCSLGLSSTESNETASRNPDQVAVKDEGMGNVKADTTETSGDHTDAEIDHQEANAGVDQANRDGQSLKRSDEPANAPKSKAGDQILSLQHGGTWSTFFQFVRFRCWPLHYSKIAQHRSQAILAARHLREIERSENNNSWQPNDSVTDTPFHVLKLVEYMNFTKGCDTDAKEAEELVHRILRDVWVPWFHELDKLDKRGSFAWPHAVDEDVNTYRLADHFWIWKTLKTLDDLGVSNHQPSTKSRENERLAWKDEEIQWMTYLNNSDALEIDPNQLHERFGKIAKRLSPSDAQRGILQRFTTENEISRKRMLAMTRSPRETRFLFHARDTALFYGQDCNFFLPGSSFEELWANTIEAQIHHNENQDAGWDNAIRYALGIVAGCRGSTLNERSARDLVMKCVGVLINISGHNGFFPGQLDEATKEPNLFYSGEERDFYYHADFEINYILLTHARDINQTFEATGTTPSQRFKSASIKSAGDRENQPARHLQPQGLDVPKETTAQPKIQNQVNEYSRYRSSPMARQLEPHLNVDSQHNLTMKKAIPFNTLIDATSIISIEEEWLYHYPHFLSGSGIDITEQIMRRIDASQSSGNDEHDNSISATSQPSRDAVGGVIGQEIDGYRKLKRKFSTPSGPKSSDTMIFVVDTPKQKHLGKREKKSFEDMKWVQMYNNQGLHARLSAPRTAEKAKKRFIWLPKANAETALLCWAASPEQEKAEISLFFDRHSKYEKHFWDDTTMVLNTWQTELHLSFYVLVDPTTPRYESLPPLTADPFPGRPTWKIHRASMGFRFDGDFFDRYWTCHFIEHIPCRSFEVIWPFPFDSSGKHEHKQWWQLKVLELYFLGGILREISRGAEDILSEVRQELGVGESTLSLPILNSEAYSSSKDNWHRFEQILHAVEEDLTSNLDTLQKWTSREKDRGQEKPRWTRSDERKYRGAINKYRGSTERQIRDLGIYRDKIRKLKDTLATSMQKIRDDRELHRNENIRYFTYVTVIFLPLGFAASFYSMNGAPPDALMISLVKFAAAAFAVTVGLLASAKTLFLAVDVVVVPLRRLRAQAGLAMEKYSRSTVEKSLLMKWMKNLGESDEEEERQPSDGQAKASEHADWNDVELEFWSPFMFWVAYIFYEIPARRVLLAISELRSGGFSPQVVGNVLLGFDLARLIRDVGNLFPHSPTKSKPGNKEDDAAVLFRHFKRITDEPRTSRPLKLLQETIARKRKSPENGQKPENGPRAESKRESIVETSEKITA
ncbi:hypothetical protein J7T55_005331 [Diaporthe amygdali]|uniref:uncharacterized protein n=1 Tax=Phomopsis amygdali TaxID=1214568 RepID=UPI0022FEEF46|nr:uncharacterized protein J7T55_005331 [Diaporthe amygdali]KAJ0108354.1 hypothetical protein J7T55_005331 [Diaporthe amygdali]